MNVLKQADEVKAEAIEEAIYKLRNQISFQITGCREEDIEANKKKLEAKIMHKLEAGKKLSTKELNYLRQNNPVLYAKAMRIQAKRAAVENRLESARSKEEVADIYGEAMGTISKNDPDRKYLIAAVSEAVREFKETQYYRNLPEKKEDAVRYETKLGQYQLAYWGEDNEYKEKDFFNSALIDYSSSGSINYSGE